MLEFPNLTWLLLFVGAMGALGRKLASSWPTVEFLPDANLRAHAGNFIKEAQQIEAFAGEKQKPPPYTIFTALLKSALSLARKVKDEPTVQLLTTELQEIRGILKNQEEAQRKASKAIVTIEHQSNHVAAAICAPLRLQGGPGKISYQDAALNHVT